MDEKEFNNTYAIPANYTDSGKLLGGMLETRNTIEAIVMLVWWGIRRSHGCMWIPP